jgi:CBS domain protein
MAVWERSRAVRRLPVIDDGHVVGVVSLGDLALEDDPGSARAHRDSAPCPYKCSDVPNWAIRVAESR